MPRGDGAQNWDWLGPPDRATANGVPPVRPTLHVPTTLPELGRWRHGLTAIVEEVRASSGMNEAGVLEVTGLGEPFEDLASYVTDPRGRVWIAALPPTDARREGEVVGLMAARVIGIPPALLCDVPWTISRDREISRVAYAQLEEWARALGARALIGYRRNRLRAYARLVRSYGWEYHCAVFAKPLVRKGG